MCWFQTRQNLAAALQKTKWPSSNVTSAGKASHSQSKGSVSASSCSHRPQSSTSVGRSHIHSSCTFFFFFSTKPHHLWTLVSHREKGTCPRVREQESNPWLETINHDLGCTLVTLSKWNVLHQCHSLKGNKDLSNGVVTIKWTVKYKAE